MHKYIIQLACVFATFTSSVYAQHWYTFDKSLFGVGASAGIGTLGFGGSLNLKYSEYFQMNIGYSAFEYTTTMPITLNTGRTTANFDIKQGGFTMLCEVYPLKKTSLHILTGVAISQNRYSGNAKMNTNQNYGTMTYTPDQMGIVDFTITGNSWMPILGLGIGRSVPKRRVGVGFDLGFVYQGKLNTAMTATNALEPTANADNEKVISDAFSDFHFFPFINLRVNVKIY